MSSHQILVCFMVRCWLKIWSAFELALGCIYRQHGTPIARDAAVESLHGEFVVEEHRQVLASMARYCHMVGGSEATGAKRG